MILPQGSPQPSTSQPGRPFLSPLADVDTYTSTGGLIRLIMRGELVLGAVVIDNPVPWVLRRSYLTTGDVD